MNAAAAARSGIVAGGALVGVLSASRAYDVDLVWLWATDLAVTLIFSVAAAIAVPAAWRIAALAAGVSVTWAVAAWWPFALYWHRGVLVSLLVLLIMGARSLWPRHRLARALIVMSCAVSLTPFVWQWDAVSFALGCGLVVGAIALRRPHSGRAAELGVIALVGLGVVLVVAAALPLLVAAPLVFELRAVVYASGLFAVGMGVASAARPQSVGRATDAVLELGARPDDAVRDRIAAALHDRSLEVGWWSADVGRFLTSAGADLVRPGEGDRRREVIVAVKGDPVAIVVGDGDRLDDAGVRSAILRASELMTEHTRLSMLIRDATREVEESRRRLIAAAASERVALARELEREVGSPLRALRSDLASLDTTKRLDSAEELIERTLGQLAAIAQGLHPATLDGGLAAALGDLVRSTPVPVVLRVEDEPDEVAVAQVAYYVCAETLANAVRHADCTTVTLDVVQSDGDLVIAIADDGIGGASPRPGSGLAGLRGRVAAAGGTLELSSLPGRGTVVCVRLPLAVSPALVEESG